MTGLSKGPGLRSPGPLLAALALALSACSAVPPPPSVVLVTVDTLRADRLGCYGCPAGTSPAIDRLVRQGTAFSQAFVPRGQTWPTLASLLTSQYPVTHGVRKNGLRLEGDAITVAHVLVRNGYRCAAALANSGTAEWPGFHEIVHHRGDDERMVRQVVTWIRERAARPTFLWVHLFAPHRPYAPPHALAERFDPDYSGVVDGSVEQVKAISEGRLRLEARDLRHLRSLYNAEVRQVDGLVHRVLRAVDAQREEMLVVLTSDHGEELCDHGVYVSHSASVHDSALRVPLAFRLADRVPAGRWVDGIVEAIDVAPTLLDLLHVDVPPEFAGRSLAASVREVSLVPDRVAFSEIEDRVVTARTARFRYVHNPTGFAFPLSADDSTAEVSIAREALYDLATDPGEHRNRAGERLPDGERLRAAVLDWQRKHRWEEAAHRLAGRETAIEAREALDALGYVR